MPYAIDTDIVHLPDRFYQDGLADFRKRLRYLPNLLNGASARVRRDMFRVLRECSMTAMLEHTVESSHSTINQMPSRMLMMMDSSPQAGFDYFALRTDMALTDLAAPALPNFEGTPVLPCVICGASQQHLPARGGSRMSNGLPSFNTLHAEFAEFLASDSDTSDSDSNGTATTASDMPGLVSG